MPPKNKNKLWLHGQLCQTFSFDDSVTSAPTPACCDQHNWCAAPAVAFQLVTAFIMVTLSGLMRHSYRVEHMAHCKAKHSVNMTETNSNTHTHTHPSTHPSTHTHTPIHTHTHIPPPPPPRPHTHMAFLYGGSRHMCTSWSLSRMRPYWGRGGGGVRAGESCRYIYKWKLVKAGGGWRL